MADPTVTSEPVRTAIAAAPRADVAGQIADEAEDLAKQIECGEISACNGQTALRVFAALVRACNIVE